MKLTVEARELEPGSGRGNKGARLVFPSDKWRQIDVCIHGQELRWHCEECAEYFKGRVVSTKQKKRNP